MKTAVYLVWIFIPTIFFILILWNFLESKGKRRKKDKYTSNLFKQGMFVTGCSICCFIFDLFLLDVLHSSLIGNLVSRNFLMIITLPIVLTVASTIIGPSKEILISRAPRLGSGLRK
jgi:hypothetical protein